MGVGLLTNGGRSGCMIFGLSLVGLSVFVHCILVLLLYVNQGFGRVTVPTYFQTGLYYVLVSISCSSCTCVLFILSFLVRS